ncbi:MAG: hypothetical protein IH586_09450, partial [Anaerolineaceae bacterium]|nr:hypothetical protein [Anaerolineaceae bacterium]
MTWGKMVLDHPLPAGKRRMERLSFVWILLGLACLFPVSTFLKTTFPIFTVTWLTVPLIALWRGRDAARLGFSELPGRNLLRITLLNFAGLLVVTALVEPWFHP